MTLGWAYTAEAVVRKVNQNATVKEIRIGKVVPTATRCKNFARLFCHRAGPWQSTVNLEVLDI
jgi:hypothetical protein